MSDSNRQPWRTAVPTADQARVLGDCLKLARRRDIRTVSSMLLSRLCARGWLVRVLPDGPPTRKRRTDRRWGWYLTTHEGKQALARYTQGGGRV